MSPFLLHTHDKQVLKIVLSVCRSLSIYIFPVDIQYFEEHNDLKCQDAHTFPFVGHSLFLWTDPDLYSDEGHDSDEESENSEALKARGGRRRVR